MIEQQNKENYELAEEKLSSSKTHQKKILGVSQKDNTKPSTHQSKDIPESSTWEQIRDLDEEEHWIERAQVITKEEHLSNIELAN